MLDSSSVNAARYRARTARLRCFFRWEVVVDACGFDLHFVCKNVITEGIESNGLHQLLRHIRELDASRAVCHAGTPSPGYWHKSYRSSA